MSCLFIRVACFYELLVSKSQFCVFVLCAVYVI